MSLSLPLPICYAKYIIHTNRPWIRKVLHNVKKDTTKILVEATVRRTLKSIQEAPERATRNLVDLGLQFSNGRFQTRLFNQFQKMLQNETSAYYDLVKRVAFSVDHDMITTFGINIGYNSCTKGARVIRKIEAERGYNIPWALNVAINEEKLMGEPDFYSGLLRQGTNLGIYTFLIYFNGKPENLLPLIEQEPNCAFILFLHGNQVNDSFLEKMGQIKNFMISVYFDRDAVAACEKLRAARFLYSAHTWYGEKDKEYIQSGKWLQDVLTVRPMFALLRSDSSCLSQTQQEIYHYVTNVRDSQQYPVICMDIKQDSLLIDHIISDGECLVGFDENGNLRTHEGVQTDLCSNIFYHSLNDILQLQR